MMLLSVVIVNYNTRDDLRACLASLVDQDVALEIIVVDNASRDHSAEMVSAEFPDVTLISPSENTWFCMGNNLGIAAASGDYVLLLNPDTVVPPHTLGRMVAALHDQPAYAGVTAQLRYPDESIQRTASRIPTYRYLLLNHTPLGWLMPRQRAAANAHHWYEDWDRQSDNLIEVPPGSCLLARREGLALDYDLLLYFPEDDLARRVGKPFLYLADVHIIHREKSSTRSWLATQIYFRDMLIYTRKHHGAWRALWLWIATRPLYWGMWIKAKFAR